MIKCDVTGFIGKSAERKTIGDREVWEWTLAVNRPDKGGQKQNPNWFTCKTDVGKRMDKLAVYLTKGKMVNVEGRLQITPANKEGQDPWLDLFVPVDFIQFTGSLPEKSATKKEVESREQAGNDAPIDF